MKKLFSIVVLFLLILSICGCKGKAEEELPAVLNPEEIIKVNLDVNLYEKLICEEFKFSLTERQKHDNFLSLKKADDGNAVFTMKREDFDAFKKELLSSRIDIFNNYNENADENSIAKVQYNADITEITVYVDKTVYNPKIDSITPQYLKAYNCISGCGRNATIYHMYNLGEIKKCTVTVKDEISNSVIETRVYPDILKEK